MTPLPLPTRRHARAACLLAAAALVVCAGLLSGAVLASAPAGVLPLVTIVCIGCPLLLAWSLPASIAVLRFTRSRRDDADAPHPLDRREIRALRRSLDRLPETQHPLGL